MGDGGGSAAAAEGRTCLRGVPRCPAASCCLLQGCGGRGRAPDRATLASGSRGSGFCPRHCPSTSVALGSRSAAASARGARGPLSHLHAAGPSQSCRSRAETSQTDFAYVKNYPQIPSFLEPHGSTCACLGPGLGARVKPCRRSGTWGTCGLVSVGSRQPPEPSVWHEFCAQATSRHRCLGLVAPPQYRAAPTDAVHRGGICSTADTVAPGSDCSTRARAEGDGVSGEGDKDHRHPPQARAHAAVGLQLSGIPTPSAAPHPLPPPNHLECLSVSMAHGLQMGSSGWGSPGPAQSGAPALPGPAGTARGGERSIRRGKHAGGLSLLPAPPQRGRA